jgi:hypothetical protein
VWVNQHALGSLPMLSCLFSFNLLSLQPVVLPQPAMVMCQHSDDLTSLLFLSSWNRHEKSQVTHLLGRLYSFTPLDIELTAVCVQHHPDFCHGPSTQHSHRLSEKKRAGGCSSHLGYNKTSVTGLCLWSGSWGAIWSPDPTKL